MRIKMNRDIKFFASVLFFSLFAFKLSAMAIKDLDEDITRDFSGRSEIVSHTPSSLSPALRLLTLLNTPQHENLYRSGSTLISDLLREDYFPGTQIIDAQNRGQMKDLLSNPSVRNIILDFKINGNSFNKLRTALTLRGQSTQPVEFMEIQSIPRNFLVWFLTFMEKGTLINGQRILFPSTPMYLKIPLYKRQGIQKCINRNYPRLQSVITLL